MSRIAFSDEDARAAAQVIDVWSPSGSAARNWTLVQALDWVVQQANPETIWLFRPGGDAPPVWLHPTRVSELCALLLKRDGCGPETIAA